MWSDELSRGRALFVDDMKPIKDELVAVLVQSKVAHAEIISVDYSEALKVPGKDLGVGFGHLSLGSVNSKLLCRVSYFRRYYENAIHILKSTSHLITYKQDLLSA